MNTPITAQQIFDTVVRHAWVMPRQSIKNNPGFSCAYRSEGGNACFVGIFLTDEQAYRGDNRQLTAVSSTVVGTAVHGLEEIGALPEQLKPHLELLCDLQNIHDSKRNWTNDRKGPADKDVMANKFRSLAARHNLSTAVLDDPKPLPESLTSLLRTPAPTHEPTL